MKNRLLVVVSVIIMVAISGTVHSETFTFSNNTPFIFNGTTLSSVLSASAVVGNVTDVNVTLNGLRVNNYFNGVEEFDVLLVGPQGTKIILLSFICDETPGPLDLTFDNAAVDVLPQGDTDVMCVSGTYLPSDYGAEGGGYILDVPPAPAPPYSTDLTELNNLDPNGTWTLFAEELTGVEGGTIDSWSVTIQTDSVAQCVLFSDEFDDDVVDWNIVKPNAIESSGSTALIPANKKAEIVATNLFAGCSSNCIVKTAFQTPGGAFSKVWVLPWYIDKQNLVELLFREDKNRVVIRQRINKTVVAKASADFIIDPNTLYAVITTYDGTTISVSINGSPLLTLNPVGPLTGSVGIRATNTMGTFTHMCVD